MGRVSHWAADLNNPLNRSAADRSEGTATSATTCSTPIPRVRASRSWSTRTARRSPRERRRPAGERGVRRGAAASIR
jgi:hypothetical protein